MAHYGFRGYLPTLHSGCQSFRLASLFESGFDDVYVVDMPLCGFLLGDVYMGACYWLGVIEGMA
jgi:hypothetical protein